MIKQSHTVNLFMTCFLTALTMLELFGANLQLEHVDSVQVLFFDVSSVFWFVFMGYASMCEIKP